MFQTSWLTVVGLAIEILGLAFLFRDLLKSKTSGISSLAFHQQQDQLETSTRELAVNLTNGLTSLAEFIAQYLAVLEMEAYYRTNPEDVAAKAAADPEMAKILAFLQGNSERSLRLHAVENFVLVQNKMPKEETISRALALVSASKLELQELYSVEVKRAQGLQRVAKIGVLLVAVGATFQFADLFFL